MSKGKTTDEQLTAKYDQLEAGVQAMNKRLEEVEKRLDTIILDIQTNRDFLTQHAQAITELVDVKKIIEKRAGVFVSILQHFEKSLEEETVGKQ